MSYEVKVLADPMVTLCDAATAEERLKALLKKKAEEKGEDPDDDVYRFFSTVLLQYALPHSPSYYLSTLVDIFMAWIQEQKDDVQEKLRPFVADVVRIAFAKPEEAEAHRQMIDELVEFANKQWMDGFLPDMFCSFPDDGEGNN